MSINLLFLGLALLSATAGIYNGLAYTGSPSSPTGESQMTDERKYALLFAATILCARKLASTSDTTGPTPAKWRRLSTGRLKVFRSCKNWLDEFRTFARDENGKIIGEAKYHLMAATRYLLLDTTGRWQTEQPEQRRQGRPTYPRELLWQ
jgi:hypothetical protein